MTELALRDDHTRDMTIPTPVGINDPTGGRLIAWAEGLAAAHRIGAALCQTAFAPAQFRGKPEEAAAAILYGDEVGFSPTMALQNIHVISGKPGMYARAMVALVQSRGHKVWTEEASPTKVIVCGQRHGSAHVERSEWTIAKARQAGYTSNKKYEQAPEDMLYARAASTVCRRIAADALAGLAYSVEELELEQAPATRTMTRTTTTEPAKKVQRKPVEPPTSQDEPELDEPEVQPEPEMTPAQRGKLFALLGENGITLADDQRQWIANQLGRELQSRATLTKADAARLIDALEVPEQELPEVGD